MAVPDGDAVADRLRALGQEIAAGRRIPILGPDLLAAAVQAAGPGGEEGPPTTSRALADCLNSRVAVPGRLRGNPWAAAQYIETHRHRVTLDRLVADIFAPTRLPPPLDLHHWLAGLGDLPLIVDTWYDDLLTQAFRESGRDDWGLVQGIPRHGLRESRFFAFFDASGAPLPEDPAEAEAIIAGWRTLIYKPHGCLWPAGGVLISDSDYVEALTEIDIQTPIPPQVQTLRTDRGAVFLGCRFYDQVLRVYARQILKRSAGPWAAILPPEPEALTTNEARFLDDLEIDPIRTDLGSAGPFFVV